MKVFYQLIMYYQWEEKKKKKKRVSPGIEPGTCRMEGESSNRSAKLIVTKIWYIFNIYTEMLYNL